MGVFTKDFPLWYNDNNERRCWKVSECMTGKEVVNLIRKLREKGMNSDEILDIIEYIETHDLKEVD